MKLHLINFTMLIVILLSGCTDEMENVVSHDALMEKQVAHTRAIAEEIISEEGPEELVISEDMKKMKELYAKTHSQSKRAPARFGDYNSFDNTFTRKKFLSHLKDLYYKIELLCAKL